MQREMSSDARKGYSFGHGPECRLEDLSKAQAHCNVCHLTFSSDSAFDKHKTGHFGFPGKGIGPTRRCLSVEEMVEKGMEVNIRGHWTSGGSWSPVR